MLVVGTELSSLGEALSLLLPTVGIIPIIGAAMRSVGGILGGIGRHRQAAATARAIRKAEGSQMKAHGAREAQRAARAGGANRFLQAIRLARGQYGAPGYQGSELPSTGYALDPETLAAIQKGIPFARDPRLAAAEVGPSFLSTFGGIMSDVGSDMMSVPGMGGGMGGSTFQAQGMLPQAQMMGGGGPATEIDWNRPVGSR